MQTTTVKSKKEKEEKPKERQTKKNTKIPETNDLEGM